MKKTVILTALVGLTIGATAAFAFTPAGGGIVGSKHDMNMLSEHATMSGNENAQGRVCAFCHTPHHKLESDALDYNPLWSHQINVDTSFKAYDSVTFDSLVEADPLTGPSRLCMSCHDGAIAVDQHYGIAGSALRSGDVWQEIAVGKNSDLSNDHPIGFDLDGITARDAGIRTNLLVPANGKLTGKTIQDLGFKTGVGSVSIMTCASCHDVHNKDNVDTAFLYEKQAGSQFCLMCHDK